MLDLAAAGAARGAARRVPRPAPAPARATGDRAPSPPPAEGWLRGAHWRTRGSGEGARRPRLGGGAGPGRRADRRDGAVPARRRSPPAAATCRPATTSCGRSSRPLADVKVLVVGPGPLPDARAPGRAQLLGGAATCGRCRTSLVNIFRELVDDLGVPAADARRPDPVGRRGRDAAQQVPHRRARPSPPRTAAGAGSRSPTRRSDALAAPRRAAAPRSCGAATRSRSSPSSRRSRGSSRCTRSPLSAHRGLLRLPAVQPGEPAARGAGRYAGGLAPSLTPEYS